MKIKKDFSFDEGRDAELLISDPSIPIDYGKIYSVAKYFRHTLGYGQTRLERELIKFCKERDKNFNPITEADTIKRWVSIAMKYELRKVESVVITKGEIEFITSADNHKDKKLLFMMLVLAKAKKKSNPNGEESEHYYLHFSNFMDAIRMSKLPIRESSLPDILHKYRDSLRVYHPFKELVRLDYLEHNSRGKKVDVERSLECFDEIFQQVIIKCDRCKSEIVKTGNKKKYCENCAKEVKKEQDSVRKKVRK